MVDKIYKSAGIYETETELKSQSTALSGIPATVIGTSERGPAFVPVMVSSWKDFDATFGNLNSEYFAPYAMYNFVKNGKPGVFVRVLGGGTSKKNNDGTSDNAGFFISGSSDGYVQFLCATHKPKNESAYFLSSSNLYFGAGQLDSVSIVRGMIFTSGSNRFTISNNGTTYNNEEKDINSTLSIKLGSADAVSISLNPNDINYYGKVLNTDPKLFASKGHLLYLDYAIDDEVCSPDNTTPGKISLLSGSTAGGLEWGSRFGNFKSRYTTPTSPYITSQRFGTKLFDLFRIESLSDGAWANDKIKISIANIRRSTADTEPYGTFTLLVRDFNDIDSDPVILEQFTGLNLNPESENYIIRRIGDRKYFYDWDQDDEDERRLVVDGDFENKSMFVRVIPSDDLTNGKVDPEALPWGHRGYEALYVYDRIVDDTLSPSLDTSAIVPIPFRFNIAKNSGVKKTLDSKLYWGTQFERMSGSFSGRNDGGTNKCLKTNPLISTFAKFCGIKELNVLATGSLADGDASQFTFANLFNLEKVDTLGAAYQTKLSDAKDWEYKACYDRIAAPFKPTSDLLNKFSQVAKFNLFLQGGWDGKDILEPTSLKNDDAQIAEYTARHVTHGSSLNSNTVYSYRTAINIFSKPENINTNLLAIPGIREPFITDYAIEKCEDRFDCFYIMDIENVDDSGNKIFENPQGQSQGSSNRPSVQETTTNFTGRSLDTTMAAVYWPDVKIIDEINNKNVTVPPSVVVLGAYGYNDKVAQPWFAPAGFNRGGLQNVIATDVRLSFSDRNKLDDASINPIAQFPNEGFVVFGQKVLTNNSSFLSRVNVRRMLIEVRRVIKSVANNLIFEPNNFNTWNKFVEAANPLLARIQAQSGLERFKVEMNDQTTSETDKQNYTMNGVIKLWPTKAAEVIALDFVLSNSGITFNE